MELTFVDPRTVACLRRCLPAAELVDLGQVPDTQRYFFTCSEPKRTLSSVLQLARTQLFLYVPPTQS